MWSTKWVQRLSKAGVQLYVRLLEKGAHPSHYPEIRGPDRSTELMGPRAFGSIRGDTAYFECCSERNEYESVK
jgi:hypothetical protein